jgi:hypothetical protein
MFDFWNEELTPEQEEVLLDKAAQEIRKRRLEAPAIIALEMHKPLATIGAHSSVVIAPFLVPLFGYDRVHDYSRLFKKKENVELLIQRLEKPEAEARELQTGATA